MTPAAGNSRRPRQVRKGVPSRRRIVEAQHEIIQELRIEDPDGSCWGCGLWAPLDADEHWQERCHIVPHGAPYFGPDNDPANYLLLCHRCHKNQPDDQSRAVQIAWLKTIVPWVDVVTQRTKLVICHCEQLEGHSESAFAGFVSDYKFRADGRSGAEASFAQILLGYTSFLVEVAANVQRLEVAVARAGT